MAITSISNKHVVVNGYVIHPLIANKCSCALTVFLRFCNFSSTQRGCLNAEKKNVLVIWN